MALIVPHDSARTHVTGESEYIDDRPALADELQVGIVYSPHAHAQIKRIDVTDALDIAGVVGIYRAADFHHNRWGTIFQDQPLLAEELVQFVGEPVLIIAAESKLALERARRAVRIKYKKFPAILSIGEARREKSFIGFERTIQRGEVEATLASGAPSFSGRLVIKGAEHFYLESQAAIAYPREQGQVEVHSSSQHPTECQHVVAHALGLPNHDVVCVVKRMGGAFGGKESQAAPIAAYAALVAQKTGRSARLVLNRDDDMIMTGKRNPFEADYRVAYDKSGKILALDVALFSDGGAYADLSTSIMERAMLHSDNAYFIPNFRVVGQVCKTHMHPHTAFRGFGGPKGMLMIERVIEEIAHRLGKDPLEIRELNAYRKGQTTHYGQEIRDDVLPEVLAQVAREGDYVRRREEILRANASRKPGELLRGISLTPIKFGISFTTRFLNQGNALVNVYRDGSVQISTGATEMGQGVYARVAQVCAQELGIPYTQIRVMPTSTEKNSNTSPTAASSGTDLNGAAVALACQRIKWRLAQVARAVLTKPERHWAKNTAGLGTEAEIKVTELGRDEPIQRNLEFSDLEFGDGWVWLKSDLACRISFTELCNEAYLNRVSICEYAHYRIPNLHFNKLTGKGEAFLYYTNGAAVSEVSVNPDTGEVKLLRSDLLMDLGRPINYDLDMGQVYGGFIQGMGWLTTENLVYSSEGKLLSHGPSTYKIPSVHDIPRDFRVKLLENQFNETNVRGSKAVGEPPLMLAISVWTAIGDALRGLPHYAEGDYPGLSVPATAEVVLRAWDPAVFARYEGGSA